VAKDASVPTALPYILVLENHLGIFFHCSLQVFSLFDESIKSRSPPGHGRFSRLPSSWSSNQGSGDSSNVQVSDLRNLRVFKAVHLVMEKDTACAAVWLITIPECSNAFTSFDAAFKHKCRARPLLQCLKQSCRSLSPQMNM